MLNRIDVVEPPNSAPQYMLVSRMMAETGLHREGQRQQQRHAVRRAEARQDADEDAEQHAGDHQRDMIGGQRDAEAVQQAMPIGFPWRCRVGRRGAVSGCRARLRAGP